MDLLDRGQVSHDLLQMILLNKCRGDTRHVSLVIALLLKFSLIVPVDERRQQASFATGSLSSAPAPASSVVPMQRFIVPAHLPACDDEALLGKHVHVFMELLPYPTLPTIVCLFHLNVFHKIL